MIGTRNQLMKALGAAWEYLVDLGGHFGRAGGELMVRSRTRPEIGIKKYERRFMEDTVCAQPTIIMQMKLCVSHHRRKGAGDCDGNREQNSEWSSNED
jgi:hypothetical protein